MILNAYELINGCDSLNKEGRRNMRNTHKCDYNCGGYALENYAWYLPYTEELRECRSIYTEAKSSNDLAERMVDFMLEEYKGRLRKINSPSEIRADEYAIAFRASKSYSDFHYAKLGKNGVWYHKMGGSERIRIMTKRELFSSSWCSGRYDSEIHFLAMKRK